MTVQPRPEIPSATVSSPDDSPASGHADAPSPPRSDEDLPRHIRQLRAIRAVLWALVGVMVVAWLFVGGGLESLANLGGPAASGGSADVGQPAPDLRLPLAGGGEVSLAQYRGQVVLVNFWATWCTPCRAEMPAIERAYQTHGPHGFTVLAVDVQEREADILAFLREVGATFPSAIDTNGEAARTWRAVGLPTSFLIDRQGIIRDVRVGPFTDEMLEERLNRLLHS
ncbi:MAG: TlpA family protein disulfide reductase [Chloroflexota bacterium]|nr:TlpA family protein disulfide reductase [Chloroflexota bacterium]